MISLPKLVTPTKILYNIFVIVNTYVCDALGTHAVGGLLIFVLVPVAEQGVQAWDRYAGMNNTTITYTDPSDYSSNCITTRKPTMGS
jgi:hypothetical protein